MSGSTYSYAYHALGELVAVIIAGCVLLEYGVATGAVADSFSALASTRTSDKVALTSWAWAATRNGTETKTDKSSGNFASWTGGN